MATKPKTTPAEDTYPVPELDPYAPPRMVRRKKDGLITNWSTLFKTQTQDFEVYYRPGTDDHLHHQGVIRMAEMRRAKVNPAMYASAPPFGTGRSFAGDVLDGDFVGVDG